MEEGETRISGSYQLTPEELVTFKRRDYWHSLKGRGGIVAALVLGSIGGIFVAAGKGLLAFLLLLPLLAVVWWLTEGVKRSVQRSATTRPAMFERMSIDVTDHGLVHQRGGTRMEIAWSDIAGIDADYCGVLRVRRNGSSAVYLPHRAFTPSEEARLIDLAARHARSESRPAIPNLLRTNLSAVDPQGQCD